MAERQLTRRGTERRRQLMDYAAERFASGGFHPTSVAEVVEGLGVGKGVFYWYFASKDELFLEILRESQADLRRAQQQAIGDERDAVRRIELGIRATFAWMDDHRPLVNLLQFAATEERFAPTLRHAQARQFRDLTHHVAEAVAEGRVRAADPELLTHAVLGVLDRLSRALLRDNGLRADDLAEEAVAFCLGGLLRH
jgi:AcrR family transcriptional regulator